jgi:uncharacterized Tic20 family protein
MGMGDMQQGKAPEQAPQPAAGGQTSVKDERTMAMLAHLLAIFTGFIGPLIIWLVKKDESEFVNDQGKEALNFQLTMLIASFACGLLTFVFIGCLLLPAVIIFDLVCCIMGAVRAGKGEAYRYPINIRFLS